MEEMICRKANSYVQKVHTYRFTNKTLYNNTISMPYLFMQSFFDQVFGLWAEFIRISVQARLQVSKCNRYDLHYSG